MKTLFSLLAITAALTLNSLAADAPINTECPVCHKDARLIFRSNTKDGKRVIFATAECKEKFDKSPGKFQVKPKS
jgi:YHS domain-containing protein